MCLSPNHIWIEKGPGYEKLPVPCRDCWRCRANRVSDYVGRSLCEAAVSDWVKVVTLTYRSRNDGREFVMDKSHFQNFMKHLRNRGLKIRYLVVGEYGDLKGRVHFHAILFGKGPEPTIGDDDGRPWPHKERFWPDAWPHGHVYCDNGCTERAIRYACKYLLKNEPGKYWFSISKEPAIGSEWFQMKARQLVEANVMPRSFEYMPPNGDTRKKYLVTGATRRDYMRAIMEGLIERRSTLIKNVGGLFRSTFTSLSEWVQKAVEKNERQLFLDAAERRLKENPEGEWQMLCEKYNDLPRLDPMRVKMRCLLEDYWQENGKEAFEHGTEETWEPPGNSPGERVQRSGKEGDPAKRRFRGGKGKEQAGLQGAETGEGNAASEKAVADTYSPTRRRTAFGHVRKAERKSPAFEPKKSCE